MLAGIPWSDILYILQFFPKYQYQHWPPKSSVGWALVEAEEVIEAAAESLDTDEVQCVA